MPEPSQSHDYSAAAKRGIRWDALAAIIASLVGLLALVVAGYTAYLERQQVRAQVWPYLQGGFSGHGNDLIWVNRGVGPAIVRSVEVTVGGKAQRDWNAVLRSLGLHGVVYSQSTLNEMVVSPGETVEWLKFKDHDDFDTFMSFHKTLRIKICYCSTLSECWINDAALGSGTDRVAIDTCPKAPASSQFED